MTFLRSFWVPIVFLVAAVVFLLNPAPFVDPVPAAAVVPEWVNDPTPVRQPESAPRYEVAGFDYRCSDCHRIIPSPLETNRKLVQHKEVELHHGLNTRCFNCHHRTERDAFVDDLGQPIPWDQPQLLCAKCHGPVYRDWLAGSHGRSNGYWDVSLGPQTRRKCIECHDPHVPPFPPMQAAPGPNTLRMGQPGPAPESHEHDPLRVYHRKPTAESTH